MYTILGDCWGVVVRVREKNLSSTQLRGYIVYHVKTYYNTLTDLRSIASILTLQSTNSGASTTERETIDSTRNGERRLEEA